MFETRYEYAIDGTGHTSETRKHLFIVATPSGPDARNPSLTIHAERRYVLTDPALPDAYRGLDVRERVEGSSLTILPRLLLDDPVTETMYALVLAAASGDVAGSSCADVLWTILHRLVLADPARARWVRSLGSEWLDGIAEEARERVPVRSLPSDPGSTAGDERLIPTRSQRCSIQCDCEIGWCQDARAWD